MRQGEAFYVGDSRLEVASVLRNRHFILADEFGEMHEIVDDRSAEVMPSVFISAGDKARASGAIRVVVEAPREINIQREDRTPDGQPARDSRADPQG
jgi:hypothetical protein